MMGHHLHRWSVISNHLFRLMYLSTRLDYLGPANLCLRLRRTARPALRPLRNSPERRPPLWTGHFSVFAGLEFPTRNGRSKAKRPVRHQLRAYPPKIYLRGPPARRVRFHRSAVRSCRARLRDSYAQRRPCATTRQERTASSDRKRTTLSP